MKNNKNILYLFMILGILLIFSDGTVSAAMPSYQFPKQISIGKAIWTVKSRGVNVTDDQLATLTEEQQKMGCAKYLPGVEIRKTGDNYKAFINNKRTNKYCEHGYELSFEKATGTAGNLTKDSNGKWVLNVCKYSEENMSSAEAAIQKLINPANIKMEYLPNVKKYKVTFLGMLNNNGTNSGMFKLKRVRQIEVNDSIVWDLSETPSSFTTAGVNPDGVSMTLDPGTEYFVSFYVNGDTPGCEEVYAANIISGTTKSIPNPVLQYTDASGNICSRVYAKYGKQNEADSVVTGAVPFCYRNDIDYREQYPTVNELLSSIANLDAMLSTGKTVSSNKLSTQKCAFVPGSMNTKTTTGSDAAKGAHNYYSTAEAGTTIKNKYLDIAGTYWRAECTEDMTIDYDDPKAVYAGGGFSYTTIIKLTRTCHPVQIRTPRKKALCEYAADCMGKGHTGGPGAGPTEDFDSCISTCDGGKYTQKCINSCYDEIYKQPSRKKCALLPYEGLKKILEESLSMAIDNKLRAKMGEIAIKAAKAANYTNAGTIEFLLDNNKNFYFMEMNTRIQVEHPITEENTGIDLEDLVSIGTIGLIKGINTYNIDKNIKLATYASRCIDNEILMFLRKNKKRRSEVSFEDSLSFDSEGNELHLEDILGTDEDIVTRGLEEETEKKLMYAEIEKLNKRDREIMVLRYGLHNKEEMTQKEVANALGISQSYISRIEKKVINRLKFLYK